MFVISLSKNKIKRVFLTALAVVILSMCLILLIAFVGRIQATQTSTGISLVATNEQERLAFISHYGWEVDVEAVEVQEVVIPDVFDDVYNNYNQIQLKQGFDLEKYAGQRVKRWTYNVRNYPDTSPEDDYIRLNLLVSDGVIIGGDVCSVKLDGFMHGFDKE
ncbi:MAG: DUF4830 domain-containing protein [Clostridia bacterium]|nr:DUF4830 domain-containing protein [Clostridia bacterium]